MRTSTQHANQTTDAGFVSQPLATPETNAQAQRAGNPFRTRNGVYVEQHVK